MAATTRLLKRYTKVIQEWPVDSSRKGRDLGEFLRKGYITQFKELLNKDINKARVTIECLEKLNQDYYMQRHHRIENYGFMGDFVINNPLLLSNEAIKEKPGILVRIKNKFNINKDNNNNK